MAITAGIFSSGRDRSLLRARGPRFVETSPLAKPTRRNAWQLVAELVSDEYDEMRALFYRSLRAIEQALSARREYMTKDGQTIYGGPDHYARLAATKHYRDFLSAGRPAPKQPEKEERRRITLQELEELLREQEAKKQELNVK